jgi:hypothetical protein
MKWTQMLITRTVDPIIDRIAGRVVQVLLDKHPSLLSGGKSDLDMLRGTLESVKPDGGSFARRQKEINEICYANVIGELPTPESAPKAPRRRSELCKQADFSLDAYRYWSAAMRQTPTLHRKYWELFYIAQALHERGLIEKGRTGLGFGVGREPLPALFASLGCTIVATDQAADDAVKGGWQQAGQHAGGRGALERPDICDLIDFRQRVSFEVVDMNLIPSHLADRFDFCWSTCSLEHLGSLDHGLRFIENSIGTLRVGGVAVHTTEFNLSSNVQTLETPNLSIYRRRDVEVIIKRLEQAGHQVEPLDLNMGGTLLDSYIDLPPYRIEPHLRLRIAEYNCTSLGLIIARGQ